MQMCLMVLRGTEPQRRRLSSVRTCSAAEFVYRMMLIPCAPAPQDVVYKDIIEPLESVSVNLVPTDKDDITLFGSPEEARAVAIPWSLPHETQQSAPTQRCVQEMRMRFATN